jgi:hypothetical protein
MCGGRNFAGGRSKAMTSIDPKLRKALTGISGILVAPFDQDDKVAPLRLKPIVDRAIDAGVHILVANGNTGEFYGLTTAEGEAMVQAAAELIGGRVPLLAGVGRSINDACALARASRAAGASALMVHQPPDPFVSPRGVVAYVQRIAEAGDGLPIMLYLRNDGIDGRRLRTDAAAISLAIDREPVGRPSGPSDLMEAYATPSDRRTQTRHQLASQLT